MMTVYKISSGWNAATSNLHRREYASLDEALDAIGSHVVCAGWGDADEDGRDCRAIGVYASEDDRAANHEGNAPHSALAVVRIIKRRTLDEREIDHV